MESKSLPNRIRIVKCSNENDPDLKWYKNKVGQTYKVKDIIGNEFYVVDRLGFCNMYIVYIKDVDIVD